MVFLRRICSSRPGDGEQRGQSVATLTARGSGLDCLQPQPRQSVLRQNKLRIFRFRASAKAQSLRLFLLSPQSGHFVGPQLWPDIVCPNRLGGMMQPARAAHGAFLARRKLTASGSSRAPCAFPNLRCYPRCWLFSCLGLWSHPHISPKEHQKERCGHFSVAALLHYVSWCASEYSVVGRISCHGSHDSIRTNVCQ